MGSKKPKKGKARKRAKVRLSQAGVPEHLIGVMIPLLELFAAVDDVMDEHDAFSSGNIHKSLGRIYRSWLDTREALDPDFDREMYRHEMKAKKSPPRTPLGQPVSESRRSSTGRTSISGKSRRTNAELGKPSAKRSAKGARSDAPASTGPSPKRKGGAYGEASRSGKGKGSGSGSKAKGTGKSRKVKD